MDPSRELFSTLTNLSSRLAFNKFNMLWNLHIL